MVDPEMPDNPEPQEEINRIGPAGETADPFVGRIVSGMPAGGSNDLDSKTENAIEPDVGKIDLD